MKSKDRITLIICTSADGKQVPLDVVGKSKKLHCFNLCGGKTPFPYINQEKAWFNKPITLWWISFVFWTHYMSVNGDVDAVLLLDNCSAQTDLNPDHLPDRFTVVYLPPNMTINHQPADMGIIASLKVGYKTTLLRNPLWVFLTCKGDARTMHVSKCRLHVDSKVLYMVGRQRSWIIWSYLIISGRQIRSTTKRTESSDIGARLKSYRPVGNLTLTMQWSVPLLQTKTRKYIHMTATLCVA